MFIGQEVHYYIVYIADFTEIILQICNYVRKQQFGANAEYSKYTSDNFFGYQVLPPCSVVKNLHCFPLLRFRTTPLQLRRQGLFKRKDSTRERRCKPLKRKLLGLLCHHNFFHCFVFRTYLLMLRMSVMITQRLLKAKKLHIYKIFVIHMPLWHTDVHCILE